MELERICSNCMARESELPDGLSYCPATDEHLCTACYRVTLDYVAIMNAFGRLAEVLA